MLIWGYWFGALMAVFLSLEIPAALGFAPWPTLSRTVWIAQARFGVVAPTTGVGIGGLAEHFFGSPGALAMIAVGLAGLVFALAWLVARRAVLAFLAGANAGALIIGALGWTPDLNP